VNFLCQEEDIFLVFLSLNVQISEILAEFEER
jgi:hypothetical protein